MARGAPDEQDEQDEQDEPDLEQRERAAPFHEAAGLLRNAETETRRKHDGWRDTVLSACILAMVLVLWLISTMCVSFFPQSPQARDLGHVVQGVIFAAQPLGVTLFSPITGKSVKRFGHITVIIAAVFARGCSFILFGLVPVLATKPAYRSGLFIASNFFGGAAESFVVAAGVAFVLKRFPEDTAKVVGIAEVMTGLGSTFGPYVGGLLYVASAPLGGHLQFFMPFLVCGAIAILVGSTMLMVQKSAARRISESESDGESESESETASTSMLPILNIRIVTLLAAHGVAAAAWYALDPTLEVKMTATPFHQTPPQVGLLFLFQGIVYTALALPIGLAVDKRPPMALFISFLGVACLPVGWAMLGPFKLGPLNTHFAFDNIYAVLGGLFVLALGNTMVCVPALPAMMLALGGRASDEQVVTLTALWTSAYAVGGIVGTVAGPTLLMLRTPLFCQEEGRGDMCFDGMGSTMSVLMSLFAVCFVWNLRGSPDIFPEKAETDGPTDRDHGRFPSEWVHGLFGCFESIPNCMPPTHLRTHTVSGCV